MPSGHPGNYTSLTNVTDHHFAAIEAARHGHALPYPPLTARPKRKVASLAQIAQAQETTATCQTYGERFAEMRARAEAGRKSEGGSGAGARRRAKRAGGTDLAKFGGADGGVQQEESEKV